MADVAATPESRLSLRLRPELKRQIERAAAATGKSLTDFVATVLQTESDRVLAEHDRITLSEDEFARFVQALDTDREPNDAFRRAVERYRKNPV